MLTAGNPMGKVMSAVLIFEVITFILAIPVMIMISGTSPIVAAVAGGAACLLALAAAAMIRRPTIGYPLGWATQVAALALGFLTVGMLLMGIVFGSLWIVCFVLGRRLEAQRAASQ
jgi:hypothetical protein